MGLPSKKITYSINNKENIQKINFVKNINASEALTKISAILFEKETNILRITLNKYKFNSEIKNLISFTRQNPKIKSKY